MIHWQKTDQKLVAPQEGYDPYDWRDPYVFWHADTQEYVMILGARKLDGKKIRTGRTVHFTSADLQSWAFQGDFWAPSLFCMHEMPDIFQIGDTWYLLTTEYSDKCKTIYRMSKSLQGPWQAPIDDVFDGRAYYAAALFFLTGADATCLGGCQPKRKRTICATGSGAARWWCTSCTRVPTARWE